MRGLLYLRLILSVLCFCPFLLHSLGGHPTHEKLFLDYLLSFAQQCQLHLNGRKSLELGSYKNQKINSIEEIKIESQNRSAVRQNEKLEVRAAFTDHSRPFLNPDQETNPHNFQSPWTSFRDARRLFSSLIQKVDTQVNFHNPQAELSPSFFKEWHQAEENLNPYDLSLGIFLGKERPLNKKSAADISFLLASYRIYGAHRPQKPFRSPTVNYLQNFAKNSSKAQKLLKKLNTKPSIDLGKLFLESQMHPEEKKFLLRLMARSIVSELDHLDSDYLDIMNLEEPLITATTVSKVTARFVQSLLGTNEIHEIQTDTASKIYVLSGKFFEVFHHLLHIFSEE